MGREPREAREDRCEALIGHTEWPYVKRCPKPATVTTAEGWCYCAEHEEYDD